jgi:hypothetical protein
MKIKLELSGQLFRRARAAAAEHRQSVKGFIMNALRDKLGLHHDRAAEHVPGWMQGFGKLRRLHPETLRMQSIID